MRMTQAYPSISVTGFPCVSENLEKVTQVPVLVFFFLLLLLSLFKKIR